MSEEESRGYVHLYTGNGKGKTTAAIGLAIRALGSGKKVFIGQFVKGRESSEHATFETLERLTFELFGRPGFIIKEPEPEDLRMAREGLEKVAQVLSSGDYDLVILDEVIVAMGFKLIDWTTLKRMLDERSKKVEVILTGRGATKEVEEYADLVTEMLEKKHYYAKNVQARKGIEF